MLKENVEILWWSLDFVISPNTAILLGPSTSKFQRYIFYSHEKFLSSWEIKQWNHLYRLIHLICTLMRCFNETVFVLYSNNAEAIFVTSNSEIVYIYCSRNMFSSITNNNITVVVKFNNKNTPHCSRFTPSDDDWKAYTWFIRISKRQSECQKSTL